MTYIIRSGGHPNKIVGSALLTNSWGTPGNTQLYGVGASSVGKIGNIRSAIWSIRETTGDFDAVSAYSNVFAVGLNKKILLISKFLDNTTHSSTFNMTFAWGVHNSTTSNYDVSAGNIVTSSLISYYAPSWKTYPPLNYITPEEKLPLEANDGPGVYLKRAGIYTFDPNLMYGYMETPSSGNFHLGFIMQAKTAGYLYNTENDTVDAHSIRIIQFE